MIAISLITIMLAAQQPQSTYEQVPAKPGEKCTICGMPLSEDDVALIVRGRRVPLAATMVDSFMTAPERYFAGMQPKGALFQEELGAPAGAVLGGISNGWFAFGTYVLIGLIFGGLSGYLAVSKGLTPIPHFFIGFALSVVGLLYVLVRRPLVKAGEVPAGLVKVPTTRTPQGCPHCGYTNHPAAQQCLQCNASLAPTVDSEVAHI